MCFFSQHGLSKCDYEFTLAKSVLSIWFFGAQHGLVGVIDDQVRVEHMFFGAQHGLDGVKSVLSICFFCAEHGLHNCESHPKRKTFAQHGLVKSVLSMFTGWFCESAQHGLAIVLNPDLLSPC
jgi:hypothetical protein